MVENKIILRPWAKINLILAILGKRPDGYHELLTILHPISLFDEIVIKRGNKGFTLETRLEDLPAGQSIPLTEDNLAAKAVKLFFENIGEEPSAGIDLIKRIPIGGGLGGGSSDAANTLTGLNELFGYPLSNETLYNICLNLGMDVPFFLEPRPALCKGRGEIIEKRYKNIKFWCVLVNPGKILSTKLVYSSLNSALTGRETRDNISRFEEIPNVGKSNNYISNDLEEPAIKICPEIGHIKKLLADSGAVKSFVCGSGSTVCGLTENKAQAWEVMKRIKRDLQSNWWVKIVSSL